MGRLVSGKRNTTMTPRVIADSDLLDALDCLWFMSESIELTATEEGQVAILADLVESAPLRITGNDVRDALRQAVNTITGLTP